MAMEIAWAGVDGWVGSSLDGSVHRFKFGEIKPDELPHPQLPQILHPKSSSCGAFCS
jgi:hypothetical protein